MIQTIRKNHITLRKIFFMCGNWARLLSDLFFPRLCAVCGRELFAKERHLCLECYAGIPLTYFWNIKDNPAEETLFGRAKIERVYSLFYYTNDYRSLLQRLKYKSDIAIGIYLGEMLGKKISENKHSADSAVFDYIIPVPLHYKKKWKRGYNQSEIIAKGIKRGLIIRSFPTKNPEEFRRRKEDGYTTRPKIISGMLQRKRFTKTQTEKDRIHRWHNVSGAFRINKKIADKYGNILPGKELHILLIDDVFTTGATLDACAQLLQDHFKCKLSIATLAYVE